MDDENDIPTDPASILPFSKELEPTEPGVERLPKLYIGTDRITYGDDKVFYKS